MSVLRSGWLGESDRYTIPDYALRFAQQRGVREVSAPGRPNEQGVLVLVKRVSNLHSFGITVLSENARQLSVLGCSHDRKP
jgi:hypothetical protein